MAKANCSEWSQNIHDMAMLIGANPGVRNLDQVVAGMKKFVPSLTREEVANAIVEATESNSRQVSELTKVLSGIKAEARGNVKLRKRIDTLKDFLSRGVANNPGNRGSQTAHIDKELKAIRDELQKQLNASPAEKARRAKLAEPKVIANLQRDIKELETTGKLPKRQRNAGVTPSNRVEKLRAKKAALRKAIANSEPARLARINESVQRLEEKIAKGIRPKEKAPDVPLSKELSDAMFKREQLQKKIRNEIRRMRPKTLWEKSVEPFNVARGLITSFDFSGVLRQGGFVVMGHPVLAAKAIGPMMRAFGSKKQEFKIDQWIKNHPSYSTWVRSGLFINPLDGNSPLSKKEEIMQFEWADKIPGVAASNRAYSTFLNVLRVTAFETMAKGLSKNGEVTSKEAASLASFVNAATGRGSLGKTLNQSAQALNVGFFAPRYVASRFQVLLAPLQLATGKGTFGQHSRVRKQIAKEYARYLMGMAMVYVLASLAGGEDEWDPRSSDFGKIKFGRTRLDPLSGIGQVTVLLSRVISGQLKSSTSGNINPLRGEAVGYGQTTVPDIIARFLRYKLSPMFGTTLNALSGEDAVGQPYDPTSLQAVGDFITPLAMREVYETLQEQGVPRGTALSLLAIFGMGIQTYGSSTQAANSGEINIDFNVN
jgi:hypothetical protein